MQAYVSSANDQHPWLPFAIYLNDKVIGFTMIGYKPAENELSADPCYAIFRFMIALEHQDKGYGKQALAKVIEKIREFPYGEAKAVFLSTKEGNHIGRKLFSSAGFVETGELDEDGDALMRLEL